jgi:hypothetical protein
MVDILVEHCINNDLDNAMKTIHEDRTIKTYNNLKHAFLVSCVHGRLNMAKWISGIKPYINVHESGIMELCCANGHLKIVQWLISYRCSDKIKKKAFKESCLLHQNHIIEWLLQTDNIGTDIESAFIWLCSHNYLNLAQHLYQTYPNLNIHAYNCRAFMKCCLKNVTTMVQWLTDLTICDTIRYIYHNNVIYIVNPPHEIYYTDKLIIDGRKSYRRHIYTETIIDYCKIYSDRKPDMDMIQEYITTLKPAKSARSY